MTGDEELDTLMARLADGEREAFTPVFRRLWSPVHRLCLRMLRNEADADDVAQQAMEKVLARAIEYDSTRRAMPWALGIAAWECRTAAKKRVRRREDSGDAVLEGMFAVENTDELVMEREIVQHVLGALHELSDSDRETLVATYWEQTANVTGATLRKRRERALDRLRDVLWRVYGFGRPRTVGAPRPKGV